MAIQNLNTLKNWFKTALKPTQSQFSDWLDSFWHKGETIPANKIENLDDRFEEKADADAFQSHLNDDNAHNITQRLAEKVDAQQLQNETNARINSDSGLQEQIDELLERPAPSLEIARAIDNKILGDIDFNGSTGFNVTTPAANGQIVNKEYADQKEINAKNYADLVATDVLRYAGTWDASTGEYPTSGTGAGGAVRRGDSFEINVEGTIEGKEYEIGDQLRARVATPGQVIANWGSGQVNTQQATELRIGIAKVATEAQAIARLSDTEMMTPYKSGILIAAERKNYTSTLILSNISQYYDNIRVIPIGIDSQITQVAKSGSITNVRFSLDGSNYLIPELPLVNTTVTELSIMFDLVNPSDNNGFIKIIGKDN